MVVSMRRPPRQPPAGQPDDSGAKDSEVVALGQRVRELRQAAGMTQESLADAAGLHWTYVGQIERGERNPTYKNVLRLARGLSVDPARLMPDDV